ncbi:uncharacterized protein Pyn_00039 [Prunus yedoensis var. nudiflora]|uniref:Fungal lipase-type domain-containing protein n=1 Tax=Prunus yedoensis var. nudiflora TaxID=2094558 RepID=A0A314Z0H6_PRUYE|nr:uncharacterized protein Pyn_00039 [Prunus yedoensis var. nudiflora]
METIQSRVEAWIKEQRAKLLKVSWGPLQWRMKWPWVGGEDYREHRRRIHQEYERRRKQLHDLCDAVKADSVSDLQDILCCMVLSECVYKRPASDLVRAVNKFKADFGGQIVSLERVQPSSDHVPHSYLLAEAGDTLFASFIGTKQYKDVMTDANIFQGAIFHEDAVEVTNGTENNKSHRPQNGNGNVENLWNPLESKSKQVNDKAKPAAHRGFLARAKGIPALELYRLAQKKKRNLVLCGHSLGGAVAVLATLAILRVVAASSSSLKENENVKVKCITFSQPPVGNAALRDYVNREGWQHYFKSYCIPEDLVPRILSPAYFHHYNAQPPSVPAETESTSISMLKSEEAVGKRKENEGEQLVLGLGPVQTSIWRLSRLVPLEGVRRQFNKFRGKKVNSVETSSLSDSVATTVIDDDIVEAQSLEIQEGSDGISLKPISETDKEPPYVSPNEKSAKASTAKNGDGRTWRRVPYLPSYVPFGELYLLENSSVKSLSDAEYSKLTSVGSVIAELRERFRSHSMKSYRFRFQRIYDLCMRDDTSPFSGIEQLQQFPHLQQWLGLAVAGTVELGHIVESPVIRTATSVAPLGWNGIPGEKNGDPLKVDITGFGLHLCTLVHAQVNGNCSRILSCYPNLLFKLWRKGGPTKNASLSWSSVEKPPKQQMVADSFMHVFPIDSNTANLNREHTSGPSPEEKSIRPEGLSEFFIFCTSDFTTVSKEVHVRTRRVRLLGLEGAGKTSLFKAILSQGRITNISNIENLLPETDVQEGISCGLCFCDSAGVNLQELNMEATCFRDELWAGIRDLNRKTDLIPKPALSLLLDEAKSLGIPWVLAVTNKFSVSAHQQKEAIGAVIQSYQASPRTTCVINSCPYVMPSAGASSGDADERMSAQKLIYAPINLVRRPFQKKEIILPVEGVNSLRQVVHHAVRTHEEAAFQELARDRLLVEMARERAMAMDASRDSQAKANSLTSAAVGASLGAGLGLVLAVVMGAASALRKP